MTDAELWAVFFQYLTDEGKRSKIIEIIKREEGIAMAVGTLVTITQDEIEYARQTSLLKGELDWQSGLVEAKREGRREGFAKGLSKGRTEGHNEGRTETSLENARKMKAMGFLTEQIHDVTGLSIETIDQL
jgi:predicted transposase/invertase (TIGR01784 family)